MYYTYVDYTDDDRPYYVGMGNINRVNLKSQRNKHHGNTAKKHGWNRKIVASFSDRTLASDLEIKLIAELHTFFDDPNYNGIGCNHTRGGEGCACSQETRRKISESKKGRVPWNKGKRGLTYNFSEVDRQKAREQLIAFNKTRPMLGKRHSEEAITRMKKSHVCSICKEPGHTKTTCPSRPSDAVNNVSEAQLKRHNRD